VFCELEYAATQLKKTVKHTFATTFHKRK